MPSFFFFDTEITEILLLGKTQYKEKAAYAIWRRDG